ncbi:hypothetical protein D0B32_02050 [Paraburkholderia sp. DHOC27]|nr:hypothetical protein D0B32_02050 [Paraburkholderia sp. DHOC27]
METLEFGAPSKIAAKPSARQTKAISVEQFYSLWSRAKTYGSTRINSTHSERRQLKRRMRL